MLNFLKSKNPIFFLITSGTVLICSIIYHVLYINNSNTNWQALGEFNIHKIFWYFLYAIVVFFSALKLNQIINKSIFFQRTNYLSGLIFLLLTVSSAPIHHSVLPCLSNLFVILALGNLLKIYRNRSCKTEIFNATCWLILSAIIYSANLFIFPLLWITLYYVRPFEWREYVMPIIAILFMGVYFITLYLLFPEHNMWLISLKHTYFIEKSVKKITWWYWVVLLVSGLVISAKTVFISFLRSSNRYKKITWILISLLVCGVLQHMFRLTILNVKASFLCGILIPFSVLVSNTILSTKKPWIVSSYILASIFGYFVVTYAI